MEIMHEQLSFKGSHSFNVRWNDKAHFTFPWHFHSDYEIVFVLKSFGKRFVADHVEDFKENDLVLLGPNLPHFWKSDDAFYQNNPKLKVNALVIHFPAEFFKQAIEQYPEFYKIKELLDLASRGIKFHAPIIRLVKKDLLKLLEREGLFKTLHFLQILNQLANTKDYTILASEPYRPETHDWSGKRLKEVMRYVSLNYKQNISLASVASKVGMNKSAFCRYFKSKTSKSFSVFLNEMRIGYACKLLIEDAMSISQICYECGFNNLSNFNRQFRKYNAVSPSEFQAQYHKSNMA